MKNNVKIEIPNLEKFSKVKYLSKRWEETISLKELGSYNKWATTLRYKTILVELRLEHYLYINIHFDNDVTDIFTKPENHFSKRNLEVINKLLSEVKNSERAGMKFIKRLSFGQKKIFWKALRKDVYKNKFSIFIKRGITPEQGIKSLENIRHIRNGIAHLESKKQILQKLRVIDKNDNTITKIALLKKH